MTAPPTKPLPQNSPNWASLLTARTSPIGTSLATRTSSTPGNGAPTYAPSAKPVPTSRNSTNQLRLRGLFTCRTEDWHFLKTVLFYFLRKLHAVQAAGDESGLGRQICWEAAKKFSSRFLKVNFAAKKHDLGFALMNQLSVAEKRFPRSQQDIAADFFALRKAFTGNKWAFSEGRNSLNAASHCDIAWAAALATHAHTERKSGVWAAVLMEDGTLWKSDDPNRQQTSEEARVRGLMLSNDPNIWRPLC